MGGFRSRTKGTGRLDGSVAPSGRQARLRFWTAVGNPVGAPGAVQLAPHLRHSLALPGWVFSAVVGGRMPRERALEEYVLHLRSAWTNGRLPELLGAGGESTFWVSPEHAATIDTFPTLVDALTRCGAEYLGTWRSGAEDGGRAA